MERKLDVIGAYISASFLMMGGGFLAFIPICAIYLFGYWVLFLLGVNDSGKFGDGTIVVLGMLYAFSIGLCTAYGQRETDGKILALNNRLHQLSWDDSEINRRVSGLVDRLEEEEPYPDENDVDILDMVELLNDIRTELEFIQDKQFVRYSERN